MIQKLKLVLLGLGFLLLLIITLQNTQQIETTLLFYKFSMPQAGSLFLAAALGFVCGALTTGVILAKRRQAKVTK